MTMPRSRLARRRAATPLGSALLGSPDDSPGIQRVRVQMLATILLLVTNAVGACIVAALVSVVIPGPNILATKFALVNFIVAPVYVATAFLVGGTWATKTAVRKLNWAIEDRQPTRAEQLDALLMPWRLTAIEALLWTVGAIVLTTAVGFVETRAIPKVAFTITFAGAMVCAFSYILCEFAMRPIAAKALEHGEPPRTGVAGMTGRAVLAWILGTAVPVTGLMTIAIFSFLHYASPNQLAVSILAIGGLTIIFGFMLAMLGTRATVDPIRSVIHGMAKIERDEPESHVVVFDGTEVGELQMGFNRMVDGLEERERIRDLFGRHVGQDVAEAALRRNPGLGGAELTVAVFFIDIIGSTAIASSRPPQEVVTLLNQFFDIVVDEVDKHGGFINKFEGDGALAIFGAPAELSDPAGNALASARAIRRRLESEIDDCDAAVGVAYGTAVAGNIGARRRFEYTVIGDPVNEAARLCDLAKTDGSLALASYDAVSAAGPDEAKHWVVEDEVTLRGRSAPTRLARPKY